MLIQEKKRRVFVQTGIVILFGLLILALTLYQVQVAPSRHATIEHEHNEQVQGQLLDVRSGVIATAEDGQARSRPIALGTHYSSFGFLSLQDAPAGTVRTVGTTSDSVAIAIRNAKATNGETADYWDGTEHSFSSGALVYTPDYNRFDDAPTTILENGIVANRFDGKTVVETGQDVIDGNTISLVALNGSLHESGHNEVLVDTEPLSTSNETVQIEPRSAGAPVRLRLPTTLPKATWATLLEPEFTTNGGNVIAPLEYANRSGEMNYVTIRLQPGSYSLQLAKVGVGPDAEKPPASGHYLTTEETTKTVETGGTVDVTVEVRDRYDNPVDGERVRISPSKRVDLGTKNATNGTATFTYRAPKTPGTDTVTAAIDDGDDPKKRVTFEITVGSPSDDSTRPADPSAYAIDWTSPADGKSSAALSSCSESRCTWNLDSDSDGQLGLEAALNESASDVTVKFWSNDTSTVVVSPNQTVTDEDGTATTYLIPQSEGTVTVFTTSGIDKDQFVIEVTESSGNDEPSGDNTPPTAAFTWSCQSGSECTFDAGGSSDPDGSIASYEWSFGDGSTATGSTAAHTYDGKGPHTVLLTVTDDAGASDSITKTVEFENQPPEADFTYSPSKPETGEPVSFDASLSTDPDGEIVSYEWDFGDGSTATGMDAEHTYDEGGAHTVSLTVTDDQGLTHTATETVSGGDQPPAADFTYSPSNPSAGESVSFDASASSDPDGEIVSYEWSFSNAGSATGEIVTLPFDETGSYTVHLTVTDDSGLTNTVSDTVHIDNAAPTAAFTYSPETPSVGEPIEFDASSSSDPDGSIASYEWDFGDGETASGATASHSFDERGSYTVSLTVTDETGGTNTITKTVSFGDSQFSIDFSYEPSNPTTGESIDFDASVSDDDGVSIAAYEWNFGDGGSATGTSVSHTYEEDDTYTVELTVSTESGDSKTISKTIQFDNQQPTADFVFTPSNPGVDEAVSFDAWGSTDPDGSIESYEWDFGDGSTGAGEDTSHTFDDEGTYTVSLTVTDDDGATDTTTKTVRFSNERPGAMFVYSPTNPSAGERIEFDAGRSSDPDGSIEAYEWHFGDGSTANGRTATHSYDEAGTYTVTLTVTDDRGATDTLSKTLSFGNEQPAADFTYSPTDPGLGESIDFDAGRSSDPDGSIVSYEWAFGDGATASGRSASHRYDSTGSYTVVLTVTDDSGATDTVTKTIAFTGDNDDPTAAFTYSPTDPGLGESIDFDAGGSSDPDGSIASYEWAFGDGGTASGERATHSYGSQGTYTISLTVRDDDGATDTVTKTLSFDSDNEGPTADFVAPGEVDVGQTLTLDASGSSDPDGSIVSYEWDFGDGSTATGTTVSHSYGASGTYTVSLTVTDDAGATDTATATIDAVGGSNEAPIAKFSIPYNPEAGVSHTIDGSGSSDPDGSIVSYEWEFGDGGTGTGPSPSHTWNSGGTYTITLTVTDDEGATDSESHSVSVQGNDAPTADFDAPYQPDAGDTVTFDGGLSSDPDGTIESYQWSFGDGASGSGQTPSHTYDAGGSYTIKLTVTDDDGATDSVSKTIDVVGNEAPTADFDASPSDPTVGETVTLYGHLSSDPDGSIESYQWSFGDGDTGSGETATHAYSSTGSYTIKLTVTDDDGATDSTTVTIDVVSDNAAPTADFTASPSTPDVGEFVSLDASGSSDPDGSIDRYEWAFGDGDTAPTPGPDAGHTYDSAGTYTITLTVIDDDGAADTTSMSIDVVAPNQAPSADFTASPSTPTTGEHVSFDASASSDPDGSIDRYEWSFGDGDSAPTPGPDAGHTYDSAGTYTVTLTVIDDEGASDSTSLTIDVEHNQKPVADVGVDGSATPDRITVGDEIYFTGYPSYDPDGYVDRYEWHFGNGDVRESQDDATQYSYSQAGTYTVTLVVYDDDGAYASDSITVTVYSSRLLPPASALSADPIVDETIGNGPVTRSTTIVSHEASDGKQVGGVVDAHVVGEASESTQVVESGDPE